MGTTWHATYVATGAAVEPAALRADLQAVLDAVEASMSTYRPDSEISAFNRAAPGTTVALSQPFYAVLEAALSVGEQSGGAYDVTVEPLVELWGFGPGSPVFSPPPDSEIERALEQVGQSRIRLEPGSRGARKAAPLALDFSSIAKGYAIDLAADRLAGAGIDRFLLEVGGEMRLSGMSGRGDPWRIAIEDPGVVGRRVALTVSVTDVAVATSGDYRNYFEWEGVRYSHTIDPRTGRPVSHGLVSVTVLHSSAMLADAWATALSVLGPEEGMAVAERQGLAVYFIYRTGESFGTSHSPAFAPYLDTGAAAWAE